MKKYLIIAIVILIGLVTLFTSLWIKEVKEKNRIKENFDIEMKQEKDRQQTLTKKEFKKYYPEDIETLRKHGVKPNQVENIVKVRYNYIDTVVKRDTLVFRYDTIRNNNIANFDIESSCNRIKGAVFDDSIEISSIESNDKLLISLYKEKRKCLFKKRGIKAIAISQCKGDTLGISENLKIGK